ncbi:BON domain-containing protein [Bdellovibrio bacteriovorus]|uniref:BON domain-containing protein n=1 Tax=Bdellovibrio TaxID=958 RepID=UPI0035A8E361
MKKQLVTALTLMMLASSSLAQTSYSSQPRTKQIKNPQRETTSQIYRTSEERRRPATIYRSDSDLQAMARRSLARDEAFSDNARNVNIRVRDGRASIQGFVNSPAESEALKRKVLAIDGVKSVRDKTVAAE